VRFAGRREFPTGAGSLAEADDSGGVDGGKENVRSVTHCITRVRFYLKDNNKAKTDIISNLDGVIDVVQAGGQYQVVIGPQNTFDDTGGSQKADHGNHGSIGEKKPTSSLGITAMGDSVFFFLPIFVGFTAAKRLGSDPIIVAIIGGGGPHPGGAPVE